MRNVEPNEAVLKTFNTNICSVSLDKGEGVIKIAADKKLSLVNYFHPSLIGDEIVDKLRGYLINKPHLIELNWTRFKG